ncbi:density-regulated protein DRP1 [Aureobasidium sp. EXF-8845]|nr:density-regulated protein DRP1 [Aureobasidium sp. EXF-8845]
MNNFTNATLILVNDTTQDTKTIMSETAILPPKQVVYCGVCSLPPEYCEFGGTTKKCEEWLESKHPDLHTKLYSEDAVAANLSTLSLDAQKRAEKDAKKKEAKATAAEARRAEELATSKITIKRVERNKRKHVTEVSGLEAFNIDIKKLAKELGKKFATGSSAGKLPGGVGEVITVQGDLSEDIEEWICDKYEQVKEGNVELVEDKKKKNKAEPPMVAPQ